MGLLNSIKNDVKKSGQNKGKFIYFREGQKQRIRFLQDMDDGVEIVWHDSFEQGINVPCQEFLARDLFMRFLWSDIPLICVENPVPSKVFCLPPYMQVIQPYQFGHPYTKKTCLWLKGLPPLKSTNVVKPVATWCPSGSYSHKHGEQHKGIFTTDRAKNRAKTFPGVANAMVEQWGPLLQRWG